MSSKVRRRKRGMKEDGKEVKIMRMNESVEKKEVALDGGERKK